MQGFKYLSIKQKLISLMMIITCIILLMSSILFIITEVLTYKHGMIANLSTLAKIIGNNSIAALIFDDQSTAEETLASLSIEPNIISAMIYSEQGDLFVKYHNNKDAKIILTNPEQKLDSNFSILKTVENQTDPSVQKTVENQTNAGIRNKLMNAKKQKNT